MNELDRFTDPYDWIGLRGWRHPERSRIFRRLKALKPRPTILGRRAFLLLRDLFGGPIDELPGLELEYAVQRLMVLDWSTGFEVLGFFTEEEVRDHSRLYGPPVESVLGHFWYGLLGHEEPRDIERVYLRRREVPSLWPHKWAGPMCG